MKRETDDFAILTSVLLVALIILSRSTSSAYAASTGPGSPGTVVSVSPGDQSWSNLDNAKASDGTYASAVTLATNPGSSYRLKTTNYGFSIPSGATVRGIQVDIERLKDSQTYSRVYDMEILIVKSDGSFGTTNKADTGTNWPASDTTRSYGGAADLWGEVWTPSDIDNSNFGVVLRVSLSWSGSWGGPTPTITAYLDYIDITIYYDAPAIIPEYPLGIPLLAIFMIVAYGLIKRRTRNPKNI